MFGRRKKSNHARQKELYQSHPFLSSTTSLIGILETDVDGGLSNATVPSIQEKYGPNSLQMGQSVHWSSILLKQSTNAMILVLILAMALSYGVQDWVEGAVITAVIILNIFIGFYQEFSAEKKMDSLRSLSSPSASVIRDGHVETISSGDVVPGDIVMIKMGDTVPADIRLVEAVGLECDEKILTGEAMPVFKDITFTTELEASQAELQIGAGDRLNMAYSSSTVTKGRGKGVVVFTGMETEIGNIAASVDGKREKDLSAAQKDARKRMKLLRPVKLAAVGFWQGLGSFLGLTSGTPLQRKLSKLAYALFGCALLLAVIVFGVNKFNVTNEVAIYAISTGIAIIPESLIAVLTISMVVGMTEMRKRKVVIRQLAALEALGGVTNICSDKTGTLTQGQMITRKAWIPKHGIYSVTGSEDALNPSTGEVSFSSINAGNQEGQNEKDNPEPIRDSHKDSHPELRQLLDAAALCNVASVRFDQKKGEWQAVGDPTEVALQVFAHRFGHGKKKLETEVGWTAKAEFAFDSSIKRMSVIYDAPDGQRLIFTKGAVERIVDLCSSTGTADHAMTDREKDLIINQMNILAGQGLRVLALATRILPKDSPADNATPRDEIETDLTFLGLTGLYDPPRNETKGAVAACARAGIVVHMLTGDHPATASSIAREVGILPTASNMPIEQADSLVKTAAEFDGMSEDEIFALPSLPLVIARCAPDTKTRMIAALHRRKAFAAMTGDGVNDAPSLKAADVGIAMGQAGSDVAKQTSDMVLTDDNFASIVAAIDEGRRMFANIQKFVLHLLVSNVAEVILLIAGLGFKDVDAVSVFPLSPLQILWINMLTSSFPAFGLGRERAGRENMSSARLLRQIRRYGVFSPEILVDMLVYGLFMGTLTLLTFVIIVYAPSYPQVRSGEWSRLGTECNRSLATCDIVFRARAAVFVELTWLILVSAWEIKDVRKSFFSRGIYRVNGVDMGIWYNLYTSNRFLFFSIVIGGLSVIPAVYIPGLNTSVFKHGAISWEWGLAAGAIVIFVLGVEGWKAVKRATGMFVRADETEPTDGIRQGIAEAGDDSDDASLEKA